MFMMMWHAHRKEQLRSVSHTLQILTKCSPAAPADYKPTTVAAAAAFWLL